MRLRPGCADASRRLQLVHGQLGVGPAAENPDAVRDIVAAEPTPVVGPAAADTPRAGSWDDASAVLASVRKSGQVRVRVVTWNMQAKAPPPIDVLREELLPAEKVK